MASSRLERIGTIYSRKQINDNFDKNVNGIVDQLAKDKAIIDLNNKNLAFIIEQSIKVSQQSTCAVKERIDGLRELLNIYSKQVEGLMRSKAMKLQDRPLWWDIYRAFPPFEDPVFARPLPTSPIKQIFYPEDLVRSKFHKLRLQMGTVKLTDDKNKSNAQKFLALYKNIQNTNENATDDQVFKESLDLIQEYVATKNEWRDDSAHRTESTIKSRESRANSVAEPIQNKSPALSEDVIKDIFKD